MKTAAKLFYCILAGALLITFCSTAASAGPKSATIAYARWSCAEAASHVVKAVLEEKTGYVCRLMPMGAEAMWLATASGDVDGFVCAWLPSLHQHYYGKVENNVVDMGPNLTGTKVGLVVPDYVPIDSIAQLEEHASKFSGQIIGVDPGAGIMSFTREAIKAYDMEHMELVEGSGASMTKTLASKIEKHEWVVITGWTPHWKFARWDLKYLRDPKNVYGGEESIHTVVRKHLKQDKPDLYRFLDNFYWHPEDIHEVMDRIQKSGKSCESAVQWVRGHPEKVTDWLEN
ncbi:MAG: glycine betaine ABC transporter substrate-binding protein [Desulfosalsimonadaceae bacterium]